ncbi:MaoC family dehydratase [Amycolatopsis saalfeldensis]|uniref:Acyl dehydratase n=1 Tax=Amycolatopsis saalfeldensis TaxID=394193 RepID=A0A1H8U0H9_9PSEU|nr:MaoC family dehydratase [Amycolatopsis saalfeldensis]SEO96739.1 Acyl dehydratase [Amycolatopsis saalfeldensis]
MQTFTTVEELGTVVGQHLGYSRWHTITQQHIDGFADATDDHQWIHVDPRRAAGGPFGTPIAHGFLTLSLLSALLWQIYSVEEAELTVNYGLDRVRFPAPVPVRSEVRAGARLLSLERHETHAQARFAVTVEIRGHDKPACVAEWITRLNRRT